MEKVKNKKKKIFPILVFLLLWQVLAFYLNLSTFPSPLAVFESLYYHSTQEDLFFHLSMTLYRVSIAFFLSMFLGIFIGILMGKFEKIDNALDSVLIFFLNLPALVTIILCYIWFGLSDLSAILAVIINKVPLVVVNIKEGCKNLDKRYFDLCLVYNIPIKRSFFKIFLPQIYPYILISARTGLSLIWKIVLLVELLGRSNGVGFQLSMFFQFFDITSILAYSFAFIFIVLLIENYILQPLEKKINQWR